METVDFSDPTQQVIESFEFGPGTDFEGTGTMVLYGSTPGGTQRRLTVDAFYVAPPLANVDIGDQCPLDGSELLPADETFPFTLFVLGGQQNRTVYACDASIVVGLAEFKFVGEVTQPPQFSPFPTAVSLVLRKNIASSSSLHACCSVFC